MLERILNTDAIDMDNSQIAYELEIDLERMDKLEHKTAPKTANSYKVTVRPSTVTYSEMMYRFRFEIQYGYLKKNKEFRPIGKSLQTQSEALPWR